MKSLDVIKRAILEGKLDTELGIKDCDVVQRFDKVMELVNKPIQLPKFESAPILDHYKHLMPTTRNYKTEPNPFDWRNKVWLSTQGVNLYKDFHDKYSNISDVKEVLDNEKN
jgi:hypothetical protein